MNRVEYLNPRRPHNAILVDGQVVPESDPVVWAMWFQHADRVVAQDDIIRPGLATVLVSTVFLGIDHSFGRGRPLWFETMIFGGPARDGQWHYETLAEARAGHAAALAECRLAVEMEARN